MNLLLKEKTGNESFVTALVPPHNSSQQCSSLEVEEQILARNFTSSITLGFRPPLKVLISPTLVFFSHVRKHPPPNRPFLPLTSLPHLSPPPQRKVRGLFFVFRQTGCFLPQTVASKRPKSCPPALLSVFIPLTHPSALPPLSSFSPSRPSPPTIHLSGQLLTDDLLSAFPLYGGFDRVFSTTPLGRICQAARIPIIHRSRFSAQGCGHVSCVLGWV